MHVYYMASSVSGQDESNPALWLATQAGKMELSCPLGTTRRVPQEKFPRKPYNKSFIDQAYSVKMAGYWPRSFFMSLWTSTPSRSINTQKRTWPSWPHTWSITHTFLLSPYPVPRKTRKEHLVMIWMACGNTQALSPIYDQFHWCPRSSGNSKWMLPDLSYKETNNFVTLEFFKTIRVRKLFAPRVLWWLKKK